MVTKQTSQFDETAARHDNVDVFDGEKFPEGTKFTFVQTTKQDGKEGLHDFTFKKFGKSAKYQIVLGTTIGDLALNMLRKEPKMHYSIDDKVEAPKGTLNRFMIDSLTKQIASQRLNGIEPTDGEIGAWAVRIITAFVNKKGVPLIEAKPEFIVHRVPYYGKTFDTITETWLDKPNLKWQVHLYPVGATIPAKGTKAQLDAMLKEKYGIAVDNTPITSEDAAAHIVPIELSGNGKGKEDEAPF